MTFTSRRLVLLWWYKYKCWRHTRLKEWCWIFSGHHAWRILFHCGMANIGSVTFTVNTDSSFILRLPPTSCWLQYQHCKWWKLGGGQGQRLATLLFEEQQFRHSKTAPLKHLNNTTIATKNMVKWYTFYNYLFRLEGWTATLNESQILKESYTCCHSLLCASGRVSSHFIRIH